MVDSRAVDAGGQRGWSIAGGDPTRTVLLEQQLRVANQTLRRADEEVRISLLTAEPGNGGEWLSMRLSQSHSTRPQTITDMMNTVMIQYSIEYYTIL